MRKAKRWRYYCDFCGKAGGHKYWIERHEKGCTMNPDRKCGMCDVAGLEQKPLSAFKAILKQPPDPELPVWQQVSQSAARATAGLMEISEGCPACAFAAIRQLDIIANFDFREQSAIFWKEHNEAQDDY